MLPFPAMDDVDGKGDGIATGPTLCNANKSKAWTKALVLAKEKMPQKGRWAT